TTSLSLYCSYTFSRSAYWGVNPHSEAVLTMRIFFPLKSAKLISLPSRLSTLKSYIVFPISSVVLALEISLFWLVQLCRNAMKESSSKKIFFISYNFMQQTAVDLKFKNISRKNFIDIDSV